MSFGALVGLWEGVGGIEACIVDAGLVNESMTACR